MGLEDEERCVLCWRILLQAIDQVLTSGILFQASNEAIKFLRLILNANALWVENWLLLLQSGTRCSGWLLDPLLSIIIVDLTWDLLPRCVPFEILWPCQKIPEVGRFRIMFQLSQNFIKVYIILIRGVGRLNLNFILHVRVVWIHVPQHPMLSLILGRLRLGQWLFILGQLIIQQGLLLILVCVNSISANEFPMLVDFPDLDIFDVRQPNIIILISQELALHLQNLNLTNFLQIVTHF